MNSLRPMEGKGKKLEVKGVTTFIFTVVHTAAGSNVLPRFCSPAQA